MEWQSFFAGATAMFFAFIILAWLFPFRELRKNDDWRKDHRQDMMVLHAYWDKANRIGMHKNILLGELIEAIEGKKEVRNETGDERVD